MSIERGGTTLDLPTGAAPRGERETGARQALPALTVLGHADLSRVGDRAFLSELVRGKDALLSRQEPRFTAPRAFRGEPLADSFLSRRPLRFSPLPGGGVRLQRDGSPTRLAVDGAPVEESLDVPAAALDDGVVLDLAGRVVLLLHRRPAPLAEAGDPFGLVGESAEIEAVREAIARVAPLSVPVLVRGETGTGKELVARALHAHGSRARRPFLSVNLGALPPALAAAELFGSVRGAYTGAVKDTPGYFVRADSGTLFLDEIGEAPPEVQVMLLRALETGEVVPVGGQSARKVDVRVVSATDADLESAIRGGGFRSPLMHRLAGYSIRLPPLRRRREDLGRLLVFFLQKELERLGESFPAGPAGDPTAPEPWLPAALVVRLARYSWPGNVRQLQNTARQLAIDSRGRPVLTGGPGLEDLLIEPEVRTVERVDLAEAASETPSPVRRRRPAEVGEEEMLAALRGQRWNLKAAAQALGIARTSLYILLERSTRVRAAADVPPEEVRAAWERHGGNVEAVEAVAAELEVSDRALRQRLKDLGLR
jgi:two-component system nitrogen regulation response regulator GlnG